MSLIFCFFRAFWQITCQKEQKTSNFLSLKSNFCHFFFHVSPFLKKTYKKRVFFRKFWKKLENFLQLHLITIFWGTPKIIDMLQPTFHCRLHFILITSVPKNENEYKLSCKFYEFKNCETQKVNLEQEKLYFCDLVYSWNLFCSKIYVSDMRIFFKLWHFWQFQILKWDVIWKINCIDMFVTSTQEKDMLNVRYCLSIFKTNTYKDLDK